MSLVIGIDLGTTTITAVAVEEGGSVRASRSLPNDAQSQTVMDQAHGRARSDVVRYIGLTALVLQSLRDELGADGQRVGGVAFTGQQHGCLLIDAKGRPTTPFISWQDRRGEEPFPGTSRTFVEEAIARTGADLPQRTGCQLATGFMATTLFRWHALGKLREDRKACFLADYVAARWAGVEPITDPTLAASSGILNLHTLDWDADAIRALGLSLSMFPAIRPAGSLLGRFRAARPFGLPAEVPIFVGLGDHQASFLGAVADPAHSLFVNVGTGGQAAAFIDAYQYDPSLETRPFPGGGYELVSAGLTGGKAYAVLETFFRRTSADLLHDEPASLFARLNALASAIPPGADGLRCEPFFTGTRQEPNRRATWTGMTEQNFTPGHLARALLEGMARVLHDGAHRIEARLPHHRDILIGAGNGIRENPLFAGLLAAEMGRPLLVPHHREEAAYGAALVAAVGAGLLPGLAAAGGWVRYAAQVAGC